MREPIYLVLASLCIANALVGCVLMIIHVKCVSRRICSDAWDKVAESIIGSEDEHEEYLEDVDWKGIGMKPILQWGPKGHKNPYVYDLDRQYSEDSMDYKEQKNVHMKVIRPIYLSKQKGYMYIAFTVMVVLYTSMNLLGYLVPYLSPGEEHRPETMEFFLATVFIPQGFMITFFLFLAFQIDYRHHNMALYAIFVVVLCFQLPRAIMSLSMVSDHISIQSVFMDWMLVLMSVRHALLFPWVSGKPELKKHIRHYIRAYKHVRNIQVSERTFIINRKRKWEEKNEKRANLMLPSLQESL
jgi:hypothetical protein